MQLSGLGGQVVSCLEEDALRTEKFDFDMHTTRKLDGR